MAKTKQALGRGLSALIPDMDPDPKGNFIEIEVTSIEPNPFQPRKHFTKEEIQELASSVEEHGLLQPIVVRKNGTGYNVIYGERRLRAFKILKRERISAKILDAVTDTDMISMAIIENIQRQDLNEIEEAEGFQTLLTKCDFSHEELSKKLSKSRSMITNSLRLLKLPNTALRV